MRLTDLLTNTSPEGFPSALATSKQFSSYCPGPNPHPKTYFVLPGTRSLPQLASLKIQQLLQPGFIGMRSVPAGRDTIGDKKGDKREMSSGVNLRMEQTAATHMGCNIDPGVGTAVGAARLE